MLTLHSADAYGNVRTAGGEVVSASHAVKGGRRGNPARMKDNGNGTYALRCGMLLGMKNSYHAAPAAVAMLVLLLAGGAAGCMSPRCCLQQHPRQPQIYDW